MYPKLDELPHLSCTQAPGCQAPQAAPGLNKEQYPGERVYNLPVQRSQALSGSGLMGSLVSEHSVWTPSIHAGASGMVVVCSCVFLCFLQLRIYS